MMNTLGKNLLYLFIFLLPWQTVYLVREVFVDGEKWQYATVGFYLSDLVLLTLIIIHLPDLAHALRTSRAKIQPMLLVLFTLFLIFSACTTPDIAKGLSATAHVIGALLLFVIVARIHERTYKEKILLSFIISMSLVSLLAVTQFFLQTSWSVSLVGLSMLDPSLGGVSVIETTTGRWLRAYGSLPHPNILGGFLTASILAALTLLTHAKNARWHIALFTSMLIMSAALLFSFSRSAWLATVIGFVIFTTLVFFKSRQHLFKLFIVYACLGIFLITIALPYKDLLITRSAPSTRLETKSFTDRSQYITQAQTLIKKHPLKGVGIGNYTHGVRTLFPQQDIWTYQPVHNIFYLIIAEIGLIGFGLFCALTLSVLKRNYIFVILYGAVITPFLFLDHWLWILPSGLYLVTLFFALTTTVRLHTK